MPAKSPEAIAKKRRNAYNKHKERLRSDPEYRKAYNRKRHMRRYHKNFDPAPADKTTTTKKPAQPRIIDNNHYKRQILKRSRLRAERMGVEFNLEKEDIVIPSVCPIFGIPLFIGHKCSSDNSPSIDRIDNTKGYTPDNIWIISSKANRMKTTSSLEELEILVSKLREVTNARLPHLTPSTP